MAVITGAPTVTIASGQSLSSSVQLNGGFVEGFYMPAGWDAAVVSFLVSETDANYVPLIDALGVEMQIAVAAGRAIQLPLGSLHGWNWLQLRSGTSGAAVNQTANRTLTLITRPYR